MHRSTRESTCHLLKLTEVGFGAFATAMVSGSCLYKEKSFPMIQLQWNLLRSSCKTLWRESLTLEKLYNCDESGLYYSMLPDKILTARSEKEAAGMKKQKDRVTLMACSNATGSHKLPLMFVGKAANPRCFKNVNTSTLPVYIIPRKMHGHL